MSFCDPPAIGVDICSPWGNSTVNHIDCATGWDDEADYGQLDAAGCDVGCASCLDYPNEMVFHADRRDGGRWLRPVGPTRDAMGRRHDLRTAEPWPMPMDAVYELASCFHNTTGEACFNRSVCKLQCWRGGLDRILADTPGAPCDGVAYGEAVPDWFPDVFFFAFDHWPPEQYCRRFQDRPNHPTPLGARRIYRLLGPAFPRFGSVPYGYGVDNWACGPDALVPCSGQFRIPPTACQSAYALNPNLPPGALYWMHDTACRNLWSEVRVDASGLEIAGRGTQSLAASAAIRTAALRHAATTTLPLGPLGLRFDRLDHAAPNVVQAWRRTWSIGTHDEPDCGILEDPRTVALELPDCRGPAGDRVTVRVHLAAVDFALYLILWRIRKWVGPYQMEETVVEAHARFLAYADLAYRVVEGGSATNPENCLEIPAGVEFRDPSGRRFSPPRSASWWGYVGALGVGGRREYPIGTGATLESLCWQSANGLGEFDIPGWPNRRSLEEPASAWPNLGSVKIWFQTRDNAGNPIAC